MKILTTLAAVASIFMLGACIGSRDVSADKRFERIVHQSLKSKVPLWLNPPDNRRPESRRHLFRLTQGGGETLGVPQLRVGQEVIFDKIVRVNPAGEYGEYAEGTLSYKAKNYPVSFFLGTSVYPDRWKDIYEVFDVP